MYKISKLISYPVISIYESKFKGIITNILFDAKQKQCKIACILNEHDNIRYIININDIFLIGRDCVFIKNASILELEQTINDSSLTLINPMNSKVYDLYGKYLGIVIEIEVDKKFNIERIHLNTGKTIEKNNIINFGDNVLLISDLAIKFSKFKPKTKILPKKIIDKKVLILSDNMHKPNHEDKNFNTTPQVNKIITNYNLLLERTASQDVTATNGEIIAKQGAKINKNIINRASQYGRLVELARFSIATKKN